MHEAVESPNVARVQSNASNYEGVSGICKSGILGIPRLLPRLTTHHCVEGDRVG